MLNKKRLLTIIGFSLCACAFGQLPAPSWNATSDPFQLSWTPVSGAVQYQLQWVFEDSNVINRPADVFKEYEPITVSVNTTTYKLSNVYTQGDLSVRVRAIGAFAGYSYDAYSSKNPGSWSSTKSIACTVYQERFNWQYTVSYSEEGRRQDQVTYFDGDLRKRQSAFLKYSDNEVIVNDFRYDLEGREVLQFLPTPVSGNSLAFRTAFNKKSDGTLLVREDYSSGQTSALLTNSGASEYYSSANTVASVHKDFIPDAQGYPYSMSKFVSDNTGRLASASGIGQTLRLDGGYAQQFLYGGASSIRLRQLFGKNIGLGTHYQLEIASDENGQTTVQYKDPSGRVVATALSGQNPPMVDAIPGVPASAIATVDITEANAYSESEQAYIIRYEHTNTEGGVTATFTYDFTGVNFSYPPDPRNPTVTQCSNCAYKVEFLIQDPFGNPVMLTSNGNPFTEATLQQTANCNDFQQQVTFTASFTHPGNYTIVKKLSLLSGNLEVEVNEGIATYMPGFRITVDQRQDDSVEEDQCATTCEDHCEGSSDSQCMEKCGFMTDAEILRSLQAECDANNALAEQQIAESLVSSPHPEKCFLDLCALLVNSRLYDAQMARVSSYPLPSQQEYGYLNPLGMSTTVTGLLNSRTIADPFFSGVGGMYRDEMTNKLRLYHNPAGGPSQTIWEYVRFLQGVNGGEINEWQLFKGLYSGLKHRYVERWKLEVRGCSYEQGPHTIFSPPLWLEDGADAAAMLESDNAAYCNNYCPVRVDAWLVKLKNYCLAVTQAQLDQIKPLLQQYCAETCGLDNPMASIFESVVQAGSSSKLQAIDNIYPCDISVIAIENPYKKEWHCKEVCEPSLRLSDCSAQLINFIASSVIGSLTRVIDLRSTQNGRRLLQCFKPTDRYLVVLNNGFRISATTSGSGCIFYLVDEAGARLPSSQIRRLRNATIAELPAAVEQAVGRDLYTGIKIDVQRQFLTVKAYLFSNCDFQWKHVNQKCTPVYRPAGCLKEAINILKGAATSGSCFSGKSVMADQVQFPLNDQSVIKYCDLYFLDSANVLLDPRTIASFATFIHKQPGQQVSPYSNREFIGVLADSIQVFSNCSFWEPDCDSLIVGIEVPVDSWPTRDDCIEGLQEVADDTGDRIVAEWEEKEKSRLRSVQYDSCFNIKETFQFTVMTKGEYHYSLNEYDIAQNLVRTIPPGGVKMQTPSQAQAGNDPQHKLPSRYKYNSFNQVSWQKTPDGNETSFWYTKGGLLRFSKNPDQSASQFSYVKYDRQARIVETGVLNNVTQIQIESNIETIDYPTSSTTEVIRALWDVGDQQCALLQQQNLKGKISSVTTYDGGGAATCVLCYSYDAHGNVKSYIQDINGLGPKRVDYVYDLIGATVDTIYYQKDQADQFLHAYQYDADNRIRSVHTSRDAVTWAKDAAYYYYSHGPLARVELGDRLQGIDYTYMIDGKLKGINSNTLVADRDPGKDGHNLATNPHKDFARDVFGYTLRYFKGDYVPIGSASFEATSPDAGFTPLGHNFYNGNVSNIVNATAKFMENNAPPVGYKYRYDQLHRLVRMDAFTGLNVSTNSWSQTGGPTDQYQSKFKYDADGNLDSLRRNGISGAGTSAIIMDRFKYEYETDSAGDKVNNKLLHIDDDPAIGGNYNHDVDDQGTFTNAPTGNNYTYDARGNLISDVAAGLASITFNSHNKLSSVSKGATDAITYQYNGTGTRIIKHVAFATGDTTFYYVSGPTGELLATYRKYGGTVELTAFMIRGMTRMGVLQPAPSGASPPQADQRLYDLTNHTGNVMAVVGGTRTAVDENIDGTTDYHTAPIQSATDYYPYGSYMPGRIHIAKATSFGFNGQMKDKHISGSGNHYTASQWEYEARIARRWNVDPVVQTSISGYAALMNNPIRFSDVSGAQAEDEVEHQAAGSQPNKSIDAAQTEPKGLFKSFLESIVDQLPDAVLEFFGEKSQKMMGSAAPTPGLGSGLVGPVQTLEEATPIMLKAMVVANQGFLKQAMTEAADRRLQHIPGTNLFIDVGLDPHLYEAPATLLDNYLTHGERLQQIPGTLSNGLGIYIHKDRNILIYMEEGQWKAWQPKAGK